METHSPQAPLVPPLFLRRGFKSVKLAYIIYRYEILIGIWAEDPANGCTGYDFYFFIFFYFLFFFKVDSLSLYIINLSITVSVREKDHKNIEENSQDQIRSFTKNECFLRKSVGNLIDISPDMRDFPLTDRIHLIPPKPLR
jgi:hypothetical protein